MAFRPCHPMTQSVGDLFHDLKARPAVRLRGALHTSSSLQSTLLCRAHLRFLADFFAEHTSLQSTLPLCRADQALSLEGVSQMGTPFFGDSFLGTPFFSSVFCFFLSPAMVGSLEMQPGAKLQAFRFRILRRTRSFPGRTSVRSLPGGIESIWETPSTERAVASDPCSQMQGLVFHVLVYITARFPD